MPASSRAEPGLEAVEHGLVAELWPPPATRPSIPARKALTTSSDDAVSRGPQAAPKRRKNVPYRGPLAPPTAADERHPDQLEQLVDEGWRLGVELGLHRPHTPVHVDAVVGVADGGVEIGQLGAVLSDEISESTHPGLELGHGDDVRRHRHAPSQRMGPHWRIEPDQLIVSTSAG